ncbi:tyrosine-type recombinase/integrase [Puniceicoccales bacterium CK1056]|uniref:Tyrosine-type recombinase/integrase n=1 Tax=Oceanipulchritudo coccoides TaxID=2706888 RepID=A0A6B2LWU5_9BACT|nr:tyrosine-type recombinase/integrase [Oceanipulchritudo coccoides]NDV60968.1 tyrosine-type recombinase/integrase [Oceanipulchritudo coccoides]
MDDQVKTGVDELTRSNPGKVTGLKEPAKKTRSAGSRKHRTKGKDQAGYWLDKNRLVQRGKSTEYYARIYWDNRDRWVSFGSSNKRIAADRAAAFYGRLKFEGWEAAFSLIRPKKAASVTVGEFIEAAEEALTHPGRGGKIPNPDTVRQYAIAFRKVAGDVGGVRKTAKRFHGKGSEVYRKRVNALPLSKITKEAVEGWRSKRLKKAGTDPLKLKAARATCNSYLRSCRALFSSNVLERLQRKGIELNQSPFAEITPIKEGDHRYRSSISREVLVQQAIRELKVAMPDPEERTLEAKAKRDKNEQFKVFLLALFCGLRRGEIDFLTWGQIHLAEGFIRIEETRFHKPKSDTSCRDVPLDPQTVDMIRSYLPFAAGAFFLEAEAKPEGSRTDRGYRCNRHFKALTAWLRKKGMDSKAPIHDLRREFGSFVCENTGIHAASVILGHSGVAVTEKYYLDVSRKTPPGIGKLLGGTKVRASKQAG